jgi:glycosyltransferase involved in cell wall biosynthesis
LRLVTLKMTTRKLNVLMIPTSSSSVMWWRLQSWVQAAWDTGLANFHNPCWFKDLTAIQPWQSKMPNSDAYDPMFTRHFVPTIETGCAQADAVVFQYVHEEGALDLFESIKIRFPHLPILTEVDDNLLSVPTYNEAFGAYDPRSHVRRRALEQMKASDGLIVSTPYLAEVFREYNPNIWVVPNSVDFDLWDKAPRKSKSGIRIGWAGGNGREGDVEIVKDAILSICKKHKDVKFVFVNGPAKGGLPDYFKDHKQIEHHARWEPILKYPRLVAGLDFDIGISPLIDSAFNRGKSNLKWLENSALGIPTVASNVGHYAETVTNGKDGFLCDTEAEFEAALDRLISDRKLRVSMGKAARATVYEKFNVKKNLPVYLDALNEAIAAKQQTQKDPVWVEAV